MGKPVRVLIVDDSAVIRQLLATLLSADPEIEVVGTAADPFIARNRIKELNPDVVTLDVEMPNMDGVTFLRKIMTLRPMPVIMISTLTQAGAEITLEALEIGAVDFIAKPTTDIANSMAAIATELQAKIKAAALTRVGVRRAMPRVRPPQRERPVLSKDKIIVIGASTGGVEALKVVLLGLPATCPPSTCRRVLPLLSPSVSIANARWRFARPRTTRSLNPTTSISLRARIISSLRAAAATTSAL